MFKNNFKNALEVEQNDYEVIVANSCLEESSEPPTYSPLRKPPPTSGVRTKPHHAQRSEVVVLMEKLVNAQQKVMELNEEVTKLQNELRHAQSSRPDAIMNGNVHAVFQPSANESCINATESQREDSILVNSKTDGRVWQCASLSQLMDMRKGMMSSLYGISDVIAHRRLSATKEHGVLDAVQRENEAVIEAAMNRLLGEAFYLRSVHDARELYALSESVREMEWEVFPAALHALSVLTDGGALLDSAERWMRFLSAPTDGLRADWSNGYTSAMRQLLVSFAMHTPRLLQAHRTDLEQMARRELAHTALLRAAQGRPAAHPNLFCLSPESILSIPSISSPQRPSLPSGQAAATSARRAERSALQAYRAGQCTPRRESLSNWRSPSPSLRAGGCASRPHSSRGSSVSPRRRSAAALGMPAMYTERVRRGDAKGAVTCAAAAAKERRVSRSAARFGVEERSNSPSVVLARRASSTRRMRLTSST